MVNKLKNQDMMITHKRDWNSLKFNLKNFWKEAPLFILFAFFNGLLPIIICLFSSLIKPMGTQYTMAIGYITAIQLAFVQIGWSITLAIFYALFKERKLSSIYHEEEIFNLLLLINFIYGLIIIPIFIGSSYVYNYFASEHINTIFGRDQAFNYIYGISLYIFINCFVYSFLIFIQLFKSYGIAILWLLIYVGLIVLSCYLFGVLIPTNQHGLLLGLGISIGSLLGCLMISIYLYFAFHFKINNINKTKQNMKLLFKHSYRQILIICSIQIFKMFAVLSLGFILESTMKGIVPIYYQLARVIWYNMMYILPFIGYGLADAFLFFGLKLDNQINFTNFNKTLYFIFGISFVFSIIFAISFYFAIPWITKIYLTNLDPEIVMQQFDVANIDLFTLFETILKNESVINALKSTNKEQILDFLNKYTPQLPNHLKLFIANSLIIFRDDLINSDTQKQTLHKLIELIQTNPKGEQQLKHSLAKLLCSPTPINITKLFDIQHANTYFYMVVWTVVYSNSLLFNNAKFIIRRNTTNGIELFLTLFVQALVIAIVVAFGVLLQYTIKLNMYDAWTLPLAITAILVIIFYWVTYFTTYKKQIKNIVFTR